MQGPQTQRQPPISERNGRLIFAVYRKQTYSISWTRWQSSYRQSPESQKTARLSRSHRSLRHNNYLSRFSVSFAGFFIRWVQAGWAEAVCRSWLRQWQRESAPYLRQASAACCAAHPAAAARNSNAALACRRYGDVYKRQPVHRSVRTCGLRCRSGERTAACTVSQGN